MVISNLFRLTEMCAKQTPPQRLGTRDVGSFMRDFDGWLAGHVRRASGRRPAEALGSTDGASEASARTGFRAAAISYTSRPLERAAEGDETRSLPMRLALAASRSFYRRLPKTAQIRISQFRNRFVRYR